MFTVDAAPEVLMVVPGVDPWTSACDSGNNMATVLWMEMIQKIPFVSVEKLEKLISKTQYLLCSYGKVFNRFGMFNEGHEVLCQ